MRKDLRLRINYHADAHSPWFFWIFCCNNYCNNYCNIWQCIYVCIFSFFIISITYKYYENFIISCNVWKSSLLEFNRIFYYCKTFNKLKMKWIKKSKCYFFSIRFRKELTCSFNYIFQRKIRRYILLHCKRGKVENYKL